MNNYDEKEVVKMLDSATIGALFRIQNLNYNSIAFRLRFSKQNVVYKQRTDSWKPHERKMVYQLLKENGCNDTFITMVHVMMKCQKNTTKKAGAKSDSN